MYRQAEVTSNFIHFWTALGNPWGQGGTYYKSQAHHVAHFMSVRLNEWADMYAKTNDDYIECLDTIASLNC